MASHDHDHEHDHGHDHGHDHSHEAPVGAEAAAPHDAAAASLARALRLAFWALSAIMVFVLVLFAFSGTTVIKAGEKGIVTVFGRKVAVVGPGLHYTWPFPIGNIETITVRRQVLPINTFWMGETPEDRSKPDLASRTPSSKGLRPGWDGALLTGDAYLLHVKLECDFEVEDAFAFRSGLEDPNEAIEAAVCRAAIQAAAHRTVEGLVLDANDQISFAQEVRAGAQEALEGMRAGVTIAEIRVGGRAGGKPTWPLRVLPDAQGAQNASQQERDTRQKAVEDATKFLVGAVGQEYRRLVGEPWAEGAAPEAAADANYNLIGRYEAARRDPNVPRAQSEGILARIDEILLSLSSQGQVTSILSEASTYKDARRNAVIARANNLQRLLVDYEKAPDFFLQRFWTEAREEILQGPSVVKWFLAPGEGKTLLQINTPPEILKMLQEWSLRNPASAQPARSPPPPPEGGAP